MSDIRAQIIREHIDENYPNAKIVSYDDPDSGLKFYTSDQLQEVDEDWFPLSCYRDKESGRVVYGGRDKIVHTYTEGETGAGKTTRFVIQAIRALSSLKVKPSFVVADIHGEIIENLYTHLKANGYKIRILNCDDPKRSDTYNPFAETAEECLRNGYLNDDAINKIRRISEIIQPVEATQDPIWDMGARSYTNGCILDKFEDLIEGNFPIDCMTIYNIIQHHHWLRNQLTDFSINALFKIPHYKKKGTKSLSVQKLIAVTNNADKTRASYFGVVENHYDVFGQPSLYALSSSNTIDISDFIDEPTVIVIQSGSTKIGDDLISLLMNEIYTAVVKVGKSNARKKLPRKIHCFLDEFANCNIASGPEYVKMLTTSRKFGMYWHMILQCDAQLDRKFDPNIGRIIRANSTEIFMGSHDYETELRFARSCGQKTIESIGSVMSQQLPSLEVVDLMTTERLNLTKDGWVYIKSGRHPLLKGYYEAFYNCEEFEAVDNISEVYPTNDFDYTKTAFVPSDIPLPLTEQEHYLFSILGTEPKQVNSLFGSYGTSEIKPLLASLYMKKLVTFLDDHYILKECSEWKVNKIESEYSENKGKYAVPLSIPAAPANTFVESVDEHRKAREWLETMPLFELEIDCDEDQVIITPDKKVYNFQALNETSKLRADMTEHITDHRDEIDIKIFDRSSLIPESLREIFDKLYQKKNTVASDCSMLDTDKDSISSKVIKFEIIERFIELNSFKTKQQWVSNMKRELADVKASAAFPDSILDIFDRAVNELDKDLTLFNIQEIKRIIQGEDEKVGDDDKDSD